jgi:hypothetical protein
MTEPLPPSRLQSSSPKCGANGASSCRNVRAVARAHLRRLLEGVGEDHHLRDRGVEAQALDVLADLLDRFVQQLGLGGIGGGVRDDLGVHGAVGADEFAPDLLQETVHALDAARVPRLHRLERAEEHQVQAQRVGAVRLDDGVGVDDVAAALGHLFAVLAEDDALVETGFGTARLCGTTPRSKSTLCQKRAYSRWSTACSAPPT